MSGAKMAAVALALALLLPSCSRERDEGSLLGVVFIVLDTVRADHVSAYGYSRQTTPEIDKLAAQGVLFEKTISNSSWTLPAIVGLLSARYPTAALFDGKIANSLIENLRDAGFETAGFTEGGYFSKYFGLDRGFKTYQEEEGAVRLNLSTGYYHKTAQGGIEHTFNSAERWLRENTRHPFFLLVHTYEAHAPYRQRDYVDGLDPGKLGKTFEIKDATKIRYGGIKMTETELTYLDALYAGGVHTADRYVGKLLRVLDELGLTERTMVVVTSDHGEDLGRRAPRWAGQHGHTIYDELIKVPLVIYDPRASYNGKRVTTQVRSVDILPTVLDLLEVSVPGGTDGRSLVPMMSGSETQDRIAFSRLDSKRVEPPPRDALLDGRYKLILSKNFARPRSPEVELFDLDVDPGETTNLAGKEPTQEARLRSELDRIRASLDKEGFADFHLKEKTDNILEERLRSLGYVE